MHNQAKSQARAELGPSTSSGCTMSLGNSRSRGVHGNLEAVCGGDHVCVIGTCDARLRRGLCMLSFIGFCNGCFWVTIQCEVWTKSKRPCKPYSIFGMNYGSTPVDFAMRNQVRMNVFWADPI